MNKIGVIAGSFDPITKGHVWLITRALDIVDHLYVVVGINAAKKHMFSPEERVEHVQEVLDEVLGDKASRITVTTVSRQLLINYVAQLGATVLIRGIRNSTDFTYEQQLLLINKKIQPHIETAFFIPPSDMTEVSSSTVKSLVGFDGWETVVGDYVYPKTIELLRGKV